jgi:hypothetical protein
MHVFNINSYFFIILDEYNQPITSIENLSNELFYEIFDYLDGHEIYEAFSNLNRYFQQLLNSLSCLVKVKFDSFDEEIWNNDIQYKKLLIYGNQIFSMKIKLPFTKNPFFFLFFLDSSLNRLESLSVVEIGNDILLSLLISLVRLPRLFSLTIATWGCNENIKQVYPLIMALPTLKYYQFWFPGDKYSISLPIATNQQFSSIEHLVIEHSCTFNELSAIISYTPQLHRLSSKNALISNPNIGIISPTALSNLTHLSIGLKGVTFDEFEIFIRKMSSKLKVLSVISESQDIIYLDAHRWEQLILQYLPQLETFSLRFYHSEQNVDKESRYSTYSGRSNEFSSSFWIKRQWLFEAEIHGYMNKYLVRRYRYIKNSLFFYKIDYLLSFRKRWYEYIHDNLISSSVELSKSARLNIMYMPPVRWHQALIRHIPSILSIGQIYHLEIPKHPIFIGSLIRTTILLPELNTLKVHSLSLDGPRELCAEEIEILSSTGNTSKITKVYLEVIDDIEEVYFLMKLCPYMTYLKLGATTFNTKISLFLRTILQKIEHEHNEHLRSLCFSARAADDNMIKNLEQWINSENLLLDYTIKRVLNNVYLQWK